ncbi:MAG: hypothetical protein ABIO70_32030 [Pseudomonadota bacterium]
MQELIDLPLPAPQSCSLRAQGRLLRLVARGCRAPAELAARLRQPEPEVAQRVALGVWLGLLAPARRAGGDVLLSRRGLELVFGASRRPQVFVEILWDHPILGPLLTELGPTGPEVEPLRSALAARLPSASGDPFERLLLGLAELLAPARNRRPRRRERRGAQQLRLGFARPRPPVTGYRYRVLDVDPSTDEPAAYRAVLQALIDEGELAVTRVGEILAELGLGGVPAGPCVELALRRGDAHRAADGGVENLVITGAALERADLSDTVATIALSDPEYRAYLEVLQATARGDAGAAARYGRLRLRFAAWDARVFGEGLAPRAVAQAADSLLRGRGLGAIPAAVPAPELSVISRPGSFLEQIEHKSLVVALPPSLELLIGGLPAVASALERAHAGGGALAFQPRLRVHGGLLYPGEPLPSSLPDLVSLRLHLVERQPWVALLVAILLEQRLGGFRVGLRVRGERLRVTWRRRDLGDFLVRADDLMRERGWRVSRRPRGGLPDATLVDLVEALGLATQAGGALVLHEPFFARLQQQPEDRRLFDLLRPFGAWAAARLAEWAVAVEPAPREPSA